MNEIENKNQIIGNVEKEFIFKFLILNKIHLEIKYDNRSTFAFLLKQSSTELEIELISNFDEIIKEKTEIDVYFYFQNNYHQFKSIIIKSQSNIIIIVNPNIISKNPKRKYDR